MATNTNKYNQVTIYDTHLKKKVIAKKTDIMIMLGIKDRALRDMLNVFDDKAIMRYHNNAYYINPLYVWQGKHSIRPEAWLLFRVELKPYLTYRHKDGTPAQYQAVVTDLDTMLYYHNNPDMLAKMRADYYAAPDYMAIFNEYILRNNKPKLYKKYDKGMFKLRDTTDNTNTFYLVNDTIDYKDKKPNNADITEYRSLFIDMDIGKDTEGKYYPEDIAIEKKKELLKIINLIKHKTAVIETRNGYHIYFALPPTLTLTADEYKDYAYQLINLIRGADKAVKDASRVLRLPGSIHHKEGCDPYEVKIIYAQPKYINPAVLIDELRHNEALKALLPTVSPSPQAKNKSVNNKNISNYDSDRIRDIKTLNYDTFKIPDTVIAVDNLAKEIKKVCVMTDLLQVSINHCCIFHNDIHPSATIYHNNTHDRYICGSAECDVPSIGYDCIDVVMALSGCDYKAAVNYLSRIYGLKQK